MGDSALRRLSDHACSLPSLLNNQLVSHNTGITYSTLHVRMHVQTHLSNGTCIRTVLMYLHQNSVTAKMVFCTTCPDRA
ncbi:hypothetical protein HNP84_008375 [Thermocatellispora tengchongensis]|uniref:Uncharacterized protein n=1 Tax=Thermocatellispora tengchongensis TaxID=1073253 RepID=A0A840PLE9_9ACTN|nr:hypothetical protein [Thermocatellispora tengchongensis]